MEALVAASQRVLESAQPSRLDVVDNDAWERVAETLAPTLPLIQSPDGDDAAQERGEIAKPGGDGTVPWDQNANLQNVRERTEPTTARPTPRPWREIVGPHMVSEDSRRPASAVQPYDPFGRR
jgi:hypothetical protein